MRIDLRTFVVEDVPLEFLMLAESQLIDITRMYETRDADVPKWISEKIEAIGKKVELEIEAQNLLKLKKLEMQYETMKPKSQVRKEILESINKLKAKLNR